MKLLVVGDFQGIFSEKLKNKIKKAEFDVVIAVGDYTGIINWRPWIIADLKAGKAGKPRVAAEEFFGRKEYIKLLLNDFKAGKKIISQLNKYGKPVILIFGNGDWYDYPFELPVQSAERLVGELEYNSYVKKLKNIKEITYGKTKFNNITFVGFGGYMDIDAYFDKEQFKEAKDKDALKRRLIRRRKSKIKLFQILKKTKGERIFVFHYPPQGAFDIIRDKKDNPMNGKSAGIKFFTEAIKKYKPKLVLCGHMHEYQGAKNLHGALVVNPGDAEKGKYAIVDIDDDNSKKIKVKFGR